MTEAPYCGRWCSEPSAARRKWQSALSRRPRRARNEILPRTPGSLKLLSGFAKLKGDAMHSIRFPDETPEYRTARNQLLEAERDLRRQTEQVATLRRALPLGGSVREDYVFHEFAG